MSKIAKLVMVLAITAAPIAAFVLYMGLPGLGNFTAFSTPVKVAYVGCAIAALIMGPGGLAAALLGQSPKPLPAAPAEPTDPSIDYGAAPSDDAVAPGSGEFDDGDFGDASFGDDELADASFDGDGEDSGFDDFDDDEFA